jgi:hypothetical protein
MAAHKRLYDALAQSFGEKLWELDHHEADGFQWAASARVVVTALAYEVSRDLKVDNPRFDQARFINAIDADRRRRHDLAKSRDGWASQD